MPKDEIIIGTYENALLINIYSTGSLIQPVLFIFGPSPNGHLTHFDLFIVLYSVSSHLTQTQQHVSPCFISPCSHSSLQTAFGSEFEPPRHLSFADSIVNLLKK